jgi:hypothetical protein
MKPLLTLLTAAIVLSGSVCADDAKKPVSAFGRKFIHRDGTYTKSAKQGDRTTIVEETYNSKDVMICKRVFQTDSQGRLRNGVVYDGKRNALGSIYYGYTNKTDQIIEEQQFNRKGQLVRRVFYPGALKDYVQSVEGLSERDKQILATKGVALVYDPDKPQAKPVQVDAPPPTAPVNSEQQEFTPGIPIGPGAAATAGASRSGSTGNTEAAAPPVNAPASGNNSATAAPANPPAAGSAPPERRPRRSFFGPAAPPQR